ncbi:hypothetical protein [Fastidiosipila sanguinis]|uniref:Cohesin domain-containing protein n=1 Tax=Fastidiosipila sanguinis TaxID=236753 RepID=A0A2S0KLU8_9FIRM|nr:hypothetical protein [Fastidiosipila sanguinis]AVM42012.1 hypothetical protein C5Q98_01630 [Fastidiosipila sanguinis]
MTFSKNKINNINKIIITSILVFLLAIGLSDVNLNAQSAVVDLKPKTEENSNSVVIEVYGRTAVYSSGYSIRINYNNEAFEYLDTEFVDYSGLNTTAKVVEPGILEISAQNGSIPFDENLLAKVNLRAIDPGVATILISNSSFFDAYGNRIPGTMLKYYQVETNFTSSNNNSGNNDSTVQSEQNLGTVGTTSKIDLDSTSSSSSESSATHTSTTTVETKETTTEESTLNVEIPKDSSESATDYSNIFKPILTVTIIIILALLAIFAINRLLKNKRKD